ncbi:hypothetical protein SSEA_SKINNY_150 [Mycobacterium phage Skinny]|uniref:Uncharacterized protein n=3 Tax=Bongovirus bongo TaxID=1983750 RepID=A0A514DJ81_9CAUD|nr:hypothetical protein PEGLEG_147 [Mycobacterium phage PegLeg]YP_009604978.1 hypothetical protein FDH95_gp103 [Mycobacterium phage Bongo]QDH93699.1 hypothetical protein SEA_LILHOMIEP_143 [Mycobacterium phage LilhomieP]QUU29327.1 hypothetical protein [Mycobacterium phage SirSheldon]UXE05318.1 hypothetical protein SSEA_SKINNY_150 [Mycobacterium phage Skinny]WNN95701.1 hypothetical protein SEA_GLASKE16_146 [Mycobacterium phage Glaske16]WNN96269.1 hypothetical protein SEA_DULCITA_144 [Mycobacter
MSTMFRPQRQIMQGFIIDGVGVVQVSTVYMGGSFDLWETAILWPAGWEGLQFLEDETGFDVVDHNRGYHEGIADALDSHEYYANPHQLQRMAAAIMRNRWTPAQWARTEWERRRAV